MAYVIAGLMAGLSFLLNKALLKLVGIKTVITYSPAIEESAKTLPAFYLGADVLATHVLFGLIEAVYDLMAGGTNRYRAAGCSIAGHALFGLLTAMLLFLSGNVWLALLGGIAAHLIWNAQMVRRV
ncbi:hypothetical protein P22_2576 [Propionispora sp. 2/2-37]|uniref:hypothetical protein n=1 Tax=Propionispora sp. 2/2-37 TaxID=1677858 RepID=UPI0006BB8550|nr:hypothetical protein [Propionispora sp. 2/2-37]CUH96486.1 hypothetical protein P22_2576 [Propionispora sp. 2/2-37]